MRFRRRLMRTSTFDSTIFRLAPQYLINLDNHNCFKISLLPFYSIEKPPSDMSITKSLSSKEVISILSKFTPCDVSDSLNKHGIANGGFIPNLTNQSPVLTRHPLLGKPTQSCMLLSLTLDLQLNKPT